MELNPRSLAARAAGGLYARRNRRSDRAVGLVLMHHGVAPAQGEVDEVLVPALGEHIFRAQLEHLGRHYEVVSLRELLQRLGRRRPGQRLPAAITFDDDLSGHAAIAAPTLEEFGFPATFFLNANTLRGPSPFWWQDLRTILDRGPGAWDELQARLAERWPWGRLRGTVADLANTIEASPPGQRDELAALLREQAGSDAIDPGLPRETVREMADRGFEIGFHTLRHYSLLTLNDGELDRAMTEGLDELAEAVGYRPTTISYPHGKADLRVAAAAQRAGFELGFVTGHAATTAEQHPMLLTRVVAWTDSLGSFAWALGRLAASA